MECILHISYRREIQCWKIKSHNKDSVRARKLKIQNQFREEIGLLIDMPTSSGGNTNDGNTARRFFKNPDLSAEITGVNLELIQQFAVILEVINSGLPIDVNKFGSFAKKKQLIYIYVCTTGTLCQ